MYFGFYREKIGNSLDIQVSNYRPVKPNILLLALFFSIIFSISDHSSIPESVLYVTNLLANNFFTPDTLLIILAAYVILFRQQLPFIYMRYVLICAIVLLVLQMMSFSRSGLLTLFNSIFIILLALIPRLRFSKKLVISVFAMLPLILLMALSSYAISTKSRLIKEENIQITLAEKVNIYLAAYDNFLENPEINYYVGAALSRAGYFDFSAELIANKSKYDNIFTLENYSKSIVDNILTPGFDVFDQPKLSNSLKYAEGKYGVPSKAAEIEGSYHTDLFGLYGEMYNIFGYISFGIFYLFARFIKVVYLYQGRLNPPLIALNRILWLSIFLKALNSFGFDWILMDFLIMFVSFAIWSRLYFKMN
jgi:hypothetical protein